MERLILRTRINRLAFENTAGVLPNLPAIVPMKAKLRKLSGDLLRLLLGERNPDPLADYLGHFERGTQTALQQVENLLGRQLAIRSTLRKVNMQDTVGLLGLLGNESRGRQCRRCCALLLFGTGLEPWS